MHQRRAGAGHRDQAANQHAQNDGKRNDLHDEIAGEDRAQCQAVRRATRNPVDGAQAEQDGALCLREGRLEPAFTTSSTLARIAAASTASSLSTFAAMFSGSAIRPRSRCSVPTYCDSAARILRGSVPTPVARVQ